MPSYVDHRSKHYRQNIIIYAPVYIDFRKTDLTSDKIKLYIRSFLKYRWLNHEKNADSRAFLKGGRCDQRSARINYYLIMHTCSSKLIECPRSYRAKSLFPGLVIVFLNDRNKQSVCLFMLRVFM